MGSPYQSPRSNSKDIAEMKMGADCLCEPSRVGWSYGNARQNFTVTTITTIVTTVITPVVLGGPAPNSIN